MKVYEFPQNERVRLFLRIEALFVRLDYFLKGESPYATHAALLTLFDLLEVIQRSDLKTDLLGDLERQRLGYKTFLNNPAVQSALLQELLKRLDAAVSQLSTSAGKFGAPLREHEWLIAIRNRISIPGGTCEFDLPFYHYWLSQPHSKRLRDIQGWLQHMEPLRQAVDTTLELLRKGGVDEHLLAPGGQYQANWAGQEVRLLRATLDDNAECAPEVSSNKYVISIRFMQLVSDQRPRQVAKDISFTMTYCRI